MIATTLKVVEANTRPNKVESLTITSMQGANALSVLSDLQREGRTGQVIINLSQGRVSGVQVIEKRRLVHDND